MNNLNRIILSLFTCCSLLNLVTAQKTETIVIDFSTKTNPKIPAKIKEGEYYQIKIKNINLNLFKVSVTSIDTILSKPQQTPTFGNFSLDALSKAIEGISPLSTSGDKTKEVTAIENEGIKTTMNEELDKLAHAKKSIDSIATRIDSLKLEV